ncbi:telomere repeat-binding factor 4-like [Macadamia integrifolia]|uniref:telomere repeat-binding factor 4-like n=1 Tax=Macadamia integrifolia TaxID=60698 RepID=UPI001C52E579|nr:telomere repeat-binding factor 4-like [Macadamia integrifolia]
MGNPKQKWTTEEEEALRAGVDKHGVGKWKNIQRDPEFGHCLSARSNIDLKDKWRNMSVSASGQGSREKLRTPKLKAITASATSAPIVQSSATTAPVAQDARADTVNDSGPGLQDGKAAPRYNTMIFDALSTLDDPNGSDISSIMSYIEKRHDVPLPQNFRRLLSSKLRRLVAQDKLEKIQNCYKKKEDSTVGTRAPPPKPIRLKQSQNPVPNASIDVVEEAAAAAAYKIAEAESKAYVASVAVTDAEKIAKMAEEAESLVLLAKQIFEQCSRGEIVLVA